MAPDLLSRVYSKADQNGRKTRCQNWKHSSIASTSFFHAGALKIPSLRAGVASGKGRTAGHATNR
jgi:hypothetical protein